MPEPCKAQACAIQDCLKSNRYDESKCTKFIDELYACCSQFYKDNGEESRTVCCPNPSLLSLKIKQRQQEKKDARLVN
ncbi:hypothetical protein PP7435_CHR1-3281 [Komagataella phaffii CBS 7435]|uniref:Cx9C motif-containing protein 4, mitochondrial n=2 Tax=Komagataella phaffii TaxID=460519 RepID=C4QZ89_KOMPG|nr:uncharacterized protein PAS_FragB_0033 [Komagataella phaffii GS115]CAH2447394.1 Hypothetical protein BQ9382_C1-7900 [Komagataella phaffii CBS 7435]CAY68563.1 hypothetical protein PAS_FragB_0033 [Komagataella phaffii GS115]SCV11943.1 hypothetical protein PP7435_CHR1-3281 [Komagataella phaffii CBS 7435]